MPAKDLLFLFHLPYSTFHFPVFYFAYAANLNRTHMARLCPGAEPVYPAVLEGYTLTVRRWFNVEPREGSVVYGGVWEVGPEHLPRLDSYEDCPGLYERGGMAVRPIEHGSMGAWEHGREDHYAVSNTMTRGHGDTETRGKTFSCMVYMMKEPFSLPLSPPDPEYLEMVREGYREWGTRAEQIEDALREVSGV